MHHPGASLSRIRFGSFELDIHAGELRKGPDRLKVPIQSVEILKALVERPGELVTREELRERLWPSDTFVDFEHGLNAAVRRLREALGDSADAPMFIETLPRRGYRFIAPVAPQQASVEDRAPRRLPRPVGLLSLGGVVVVALAFAVWAVTMFRDKDSKTELTRVRTVPVTRFPGQEVDAAISPDGRHVAFTWDGESGTNRDIYVKLLDGGGTPMRLSTDPAIERFPSWSPDGNSIAFVRREGPTGAAIIIVPAFGGPERRVRPKTTPEIGSPVWAGGVSWAPRGDAIVFPMRLVAGGNIVVAICDLGTGETRQLTQPTQDFFDGSGTISPDGQRLAFVRHIQGFAAGRVFVQRLERLEPVGDPQRLTENPSTGNVTWAPDSQHVVFDGRVGVVQGIWRVSVRGGVPESVLVNVAAIHPSIARSGSRLVYYRETVDMNIWKAEIPNGGSSKISGQLIADSTAFDGHPQFSPDGQRIVFVSTRSGGGRALWVSKADGSQPRQLSAAEADFGSPRWSTDGKSLVVDTNRTGSYNIYAIDAEGGGERAITSDAFSNARASWSGDGRWIYFASTRSGSWQVWKIRPDRSSLRQVTKKGGFEALESPDGRSVYYTIRGAPSIWRVPVDGGEEVRVIDHGREGAWALTDTSLVLFNRTADPVVRSSVEFFDLSTNRLFKVLEWPPGEHFDMTDPCFSVTRDGRWMLYVRSDRWGADIDMLEGIK